MPLSSLRDALRSRNPELFQETLGLIQRITPLLWHSIATFPSGTSHTSEHTATVEAIASQLVTSDLVRALYDDELQILILACHFHDLGMVGTEADNADASSRENVRRDHAIRIGDRIRSEWETLGFRDITAAEALAEVCRGHRPRKVNGKAHWDDIREHAVIGPNRVVRLRSMSALIYAADELHIGADRATTREQKWLEIRNEESRRHWERHQCITGPAPRKGRLCFDIKVSTPVLEADIRKHVLRKACSAVQDARDQLIKDDLPSQLPQISVQWVREAMWRLLLLRAQSDHKARTESTLADAIQAIFASDGADFDILADICVDASAGTGSLKAEILRVVQDFRIRHYLVPVSDSESMK